MVKISHTPQRFAFTMIELIFAIVIIAISIMSLPMMTQVTSSAMEKSLVQEAIFASVAEINLATTYVWDENSLIDANDSSTAENDLSRVLNLTSTCIPTGITVGGVEIIRKTGHINRRCINNNLTARYTGTDYLYALEASKHPSSTVYIGENTSSQGYKQNYYSILDVENCDSGNCVPFGLEANNIDLKEITLTVQNDNNETVTLLRTYSANIGEVAYANEVLP